jgi:hypothetical protein
MPPKKMYPPYWRRYRRHYRNPVKGTHEEGLVLHPDKLDNQLCLDVYVDASFACGWGTELGTNPDSVKSRTGYILSR